LDIQPIEPGKLKITLTGYDMEQLKLTYEQIDYDDPHTRGVLWELVKTSGNQEQFNRCGRLLIEVFPAPHSGCMIYFTALKRYAAKPAPLKPESSKPEGKYIYSYSFIGFEELQSAVSAAAVSEEIKTPDSRLYYHSGQYHLVFSAEPPYAVHRMLCEFSAAHDNTLESGLILAEHGQLAIKRGAIEVLREIM